MKIEDEKIIDAARAIQEIDSTCPEGYRFSQLPDCLRETIAEACIANRIIIGPSKETEQLYHHYLSVGKPLVIKVADTVIEAESS